MANYSEKVFLYLQICFGNVDLGAYKADTETGSLYSTLLAIYQSAPRIAKGASRSESPDVLWH